MFKYIKEKLRLIKKTIMFYVSYYDNKDKEEELSILEKARFFDKD